MKKVISKAFEKEADKLSEIISTFEERGTIIYGGNRNTIKTVQLGNKTINIKAFKIPHLVNKIAYRFFRKSKAQRSFEFANKLLSKGIGTPVPIAYFENRTSFELLDSYYVSEHLQHDFTFRKLIENEEEVPEWEMILKKFTHFTFQLHEKNIQFLDHTSGNTLIKFNKGNPTFYLVDLNRMRFKKLSYEERIANFGKLTPRKDMVKLMSYEYAKLIAKDPEAVFEKMWAYTEAFQQKFERKRALKKKLKFWKQ